MPRLNPLIALQTLILCVYVALITFLPSFDFMPKSIVFYHDKQRLLEVVLLGLVLLDGALIGQKNHISIPVNNKMHFAFYLLFAFTSVSVFFAKSPRHAVIEVSVFAGLAYLTFFVVRLYNENKEIFIKQLTYAIWASLLLYIVGFYVGYITACVFRTPLAWPKPFLGFSNIRSFNQYQLWTLGIICLPLLAFELKNNTRRILHIALAGWLVLLFYSASRGVLVAWFLGMFVTTLVYRRLAWPFLRLQLISMITGFFGYVILFKVLPAFLSLELVTGTILRDSINDRIGIWNEALVLVKSFPWFGVGPMHFAWYSTSVGHPHNSVLQLAAEWGLPATLIILTVAGYGITCWQKQFNANKLSSYSKLDNNLAIILFFTIFTNAAYSLVDGVIVMPISQVLMFTMIGLTIGQYANLRLSEIKHDAFNNKKRIRHIFAAITLVALVWSTLPELVRGLSGNVKGFSMGYVAEGPRFWREIK